MPGFFRKMKVTRSGDISISLNVTGLTLVKGHTN